MFFLLKREKKVEITYSAPEFSFLIYILKWEEHCVAMPMVRRNIKRTKSPKTTQNEQKNLFKLKSI